MSNQNRSLLLHLLHLSAPKEKSPTVRVPTWDDLLRGTGLGANELRLALVTLERRGLVDASRLRLTLAGLGVAAGMRAKLGRPPARAPKDQGGRVLEARHGEAASPTPSIPSRPGGTGARKPSSLGMAHAA
ncbi:MAG: hypothetical protein JW751_09400 [Polyangiaceae bacterium]|nr:hypothetical protein [Polyangiaceae bacterium]